MSLFLRREYFFLAGFFLILQAFCVITGGERLPMLARGAKKLCCAAAVGLLRVGTSFREAYLDHVRMFC
jgi:hypothetical protein